jgi:DNA-binding winged helix-turn-helix (wHTH) protein
MTSETDSMESAQTTGDVIYFGEFTLDLKRHGLFVGADRVHLTSKPVETLIYLVENRGRVVEKRELMDTVWKDVFVTEDTLVHAIREIRRALSDDREDPRYVQTVPRKAIGSSRTCRSSQVSRMNRRDRQSPRALPQDRAGRFRWRRRSSLWDCC